MKQRIITALLALPIVLWLILYAPPILFGFVCAMAAALTAFEYFSFTGTKSLYLLLVLFLAVFTFSFGVPFGLAAGFVLIYTSIALRLTRENPTRNYVSATARYSFAYIYIGGGYAAMLLLHQQHPLQLLGLLLAIWATDSLAYFCGKALGRHRMAPSISPGKTWEGYIGGILGGTLALGVASTFFDIGIPAPWLMGAFIGTISVAGDLIESAMKRDAGIKDSGRLLAGHGGLFDRMDSAIFTAPLFYVLLNTIEALQHG